MITRDSRKSGYTIVEALLFLGISSLLLVSALATVDGQQARSEFRQSMYDIQTKIEDVINDVSTGYYTNSTGFTCTPGAGSNPPVITSGGAQGTNAGCIFLGRVIHFAPDSDNTAFRVHTVVGKRSADASGTPVSSIADATPVAIFPRSAVPSVPDGSESFTLEYGSTVSRMTYSGSHPIGAFGIYTNLASYTSGGSSLPSGGISAQLVPITGTNLNDSSVAISDAITSSGAVTDQPISICFLSGGTNQHAVINIGDNAGRLTTSLRISGGRTCP